jgi:XTP/dITP diphosphohydrolase
MKEIVFATNNQHKLEEVRAMLGDSYKVVSLKEIGCFDDIPETADTLKGNALQKAEWVKERYGYDCFADDTGLEVEALGGAPGVYSARYAGENVTYADNNRKLLQEMKGKTNRNAAFKTVICLILNGETHFFEGEVRGRIIEENRGTTGFGYDPVFIPEGYDVTFAEMGAELKNKISHRARATAALVKFIKAGN